LSRLAEVAGEFGLTAETARLDWKKLNSTPFNHPLLLILKNGNAVVLMGLQRDGAEAAAISDLLHREGEVFFVPRVELERVWGGTALIITPLPPAKEETRFGFS